MECYCCLRNVQDLVSGGKTPYERRFGEPFKGPKIPFGSMIEDHPISAKDMSGLHQLGKKVYLEYSSDMPCTRGESAKRRILVSDIEELERMDASEIHARRLNAKEVRTPRRMVIISYAWRNQDLRTSTLMRDHPKRREEREDLLGESEGSPPPQDSFSDAGEARNDFWSIPPSR